MIAGAGVLTVFLAQSHSEDVGARLCKTAQNITQSGVSVTGEFSKFKNASVS